MAIDLDLDPDFCAVLARAVSLHGEAVPSVSLPCPAAAASNRLYVRRMAMGRPAPGESWSHRDLRALIPAELERMGLEASPCPDPSCVVCNPPICPVCGGIA